MASRKFVVQGWRRRRYVNVALFQGHYGTFTTEISGCADRNLNHKRKAKCSYERTISTTIGIGISAVGTEFHWGRGINSITVVISEFQCINLP